MWIVKKHQDFWNITICNVQGLAAKENELVGEFERENLDILRIIEAKNKGSGEMEMGGGHLLIYKGVSGDSRAKEGVGCNINKKYKKYISKWIGETERIRRVEVKTIENVTM